MKSVHMVAFAAVAILGSSAIAAKPDDANWLQWRGPQREGKSTSTGLLKDWDAQPPKLLGMVEGLGGGYASVSIVDGMLYTTGNFDDAQGVVAVDLATNQVAWKTPVTAEIPKHGYGGSRSTPTIDGDDLYVVLSDGTVACLDRMSGKVVWTRSFEKEYGAKRPNWGFAESPLVDGNLLICTPGSDQALLLALNKKTGKEVWATKDAKLGDKGKGEAGYSSIVIGNGAGVKQYVQMTGRGLVAVRAKDGKFLYNYNPVANDVAVIPTPIVDGDYVFVSSGYQTGAGLVKLSKTRDGVSAEEVYFLEPKTFQNHHGGMVKLGDYIYAGTKHNEGFPICIEMKTGEVQWGGDKRGEGKGSAAVLYADGNFIFRYQSGEIVLVEATPKEYVLKGKFMPEYQERESWSHPVVVDGKLYLREQDKLMIYDLTQN
ncbi:PQQ-binding-like beta-propeller repeat protein [Blastopirellula marina]|nr:PQQ-binding-like beta-propeller repeat protein [Blastopirellula marina]